MARKSSERMRVLLRLAEMKEQAAARRLAASSEHLHKAQEQGRQLALYEQDYQRQYVEHSAQPKTRQALLNFQGFFRQLEQVQVQQVRTIEHRDSEREQARLRWIDLYARRSLLAKIRERRLLSEQAEIEKRLQREIDDRAARTQSVLAKSLESTS